MARGPTSVTPLREHRRGSSLGGVHELAHQQGRLAHREAAANHDGGGGGLVATWQRADEDVYETMLEDEGAFEREQSGPSPFC